MFADKQSSFEKLKKLKEANIIKKSKKYILQIKQFMFEKKNIAQNSEKN